MNHKISKLTVEKEKNIAKIADLQARNKEIDGQITELENFDIVGIVRDNGITPEMLAEIIRAVKQKPLPINLGNTGKTEESDEDN